MRLTKGFCFEAFSLVPQTGDGFFLQPELCHVDVSIDACVSHTGFLGVLGRLDAALRNALDQRLTRQVLIAGDQEHLACHPRLRRYGRAIVLPPDGHMARLSCELFVEVCWPALAALGCRPRSVTVYQGLRNRARTEVELCCDASVEGYLPALAAARTVCEPPPESRLRFA